ncbi:MAG TPA: SDR family oxidoreductase [Ignavibacteria bacterium]|nr:SDR family oxidoreductase [Ignavibacteria bacterium]
MRTTDPEKINFIDKFSLNGKAIIISGGMGLIGRAFAEACAQFGANVVIADIEKMDPAEHAENLNKRFGRKMLGVAINVSDRKDVENLKNKCIENFGRIDGLVNCHQNKTAKFFAKFEEYEDEDWDAVVETNLKGTYLTCQIIGSYMAAQGSGSIVNMPSTYSVVAPNQNLYTGTSLGCPAAYSASKGGVMALSQYLSTYWADKGVRVNQITPHGVWNNHEKKFEENFSRFSPMKRMSYNHEVANALVFLLSDASSYVTGDNIRVDGGWTAW